MQLVVNNIKISVPLIKTVKSYKKKWIQRDALAGLTVAAVAVPQAMAYAQLAGLPLAAGLYTALLAMIIFAFFTTSRFVIVGPDAAMAALTAAALAPLAITDSRHYMSLVMVLAVLIGIVCFIALFARLAIIAEFISRPILLGYMAGLALAVIASQLPKLFGMNASPQGNFFTTITNIFTNFGSINWLTFLFSFLLIGAAIVLRRYAKRIPASLLLLVGSIIVSYIFDLGSRGLPIVGTVPTGLPLPVWPEVTIFEIQNLVIPAIMISLVSYANTIATERSFAKGQKESVETPQEFFGLGASNVGSGIFGGMPVAASGARTAVNVESKAATQVSQLFGALSIAAVLIFFAPMLTYLPQASLAVIVIMAVMGLFNLKELKSIWHAWKSEAILAIVTLIGVTLLGIFQGLLLAVLLAVMNFVRKNTMPQYAVLGRAEDGSLRDMHRPPKTKAIPGMIIFRYDAPLYFVNAAYFKDTVHGLIDDADEPVKWVLWDAETVTAIDSTAARMLLELIRDLKSKDITFAIARMKGPLRQTINHSHRLSRTISSTPHFTSMGDALEAYYADQNIESDFKEKLSIEEKN